MRILFDALSLGVRPSGTRARLLGLAPALMDRSVHVGVLHGPGLSDEERRILHRAQMIEEPRPPRGPLARWRRQTGLLTAARDQVGARYVVVECLPWPKIEGLVGVIHDLRHLATPGWRGRLAHRVINASLSRARQIHVVSDATGERLLTAFGPRETRVVPNGVDTTFFSPVADPRDDDVLAGYGVRPGSILCVGHLERRKAPDLALGVRASLARRGVDVPIVFVGKGDYLPEEGLAYLRGEHPTQNIGKVVRNVAREHLPAFYRRAGCVLAPARDEGFGIAPLEAIACGAPVVASRIPAHLEVLGGAVRYASVDDLVGFTSHVLDVIEGRDETLREAGPVQAREWSWTRAADRFMKALDP